MFLHCFILFWYKQASLLIKNRYHYPQDENNINYHLQYYSGETIMQRIKSHSQ